MIAEDFSIDPSTSTEFQRDMEDQQPSSSNTTPVDVEEPKPSTNKSAHKRKDGEGLIYIPLKYLFGIKPKFHSKLPDWRSVLQGHNKLSPQAEVLHEFSTSLQNTARRLHAKDVSNQTHIKHAIDAAKCAELFRSHMNSETSFNIFLSQLKHRQFKPTRRHFSMEDKIAAMPIFNQSPKVYRYLSKMFALPPRKCLQELLNRIPIGPGMNDLIFEMLKDECEYMSEEGKYCALLFNKMPLSPGMYFNKADSSIDGFVYPDEQHLRFADHVMVFMVRGVLRKWKQPLAYFFVECGMSVPDLTRTIKTIIRDLQDIGLHVVATVCDQHATNVQTIQELIGETSRRLALEGKENRTNGFLIGDEEIFPLFDPPHLLKCVRNNLLKYIATFKWKGTSFTSCWSDIVHLYELANKSFESRVLTNISDCHMYEPKMNKMKVNLASQVLSQQAGGLMNLLATKCKKEYTTDTLAGTTQFLIFFDKLFDSVNGSSIHYKKMKPLRCSITAQRGHLRFYSEAIQVLRTMKFKKSTGEFIPPCIVNWITTLKGLQCIWNRLHSEDVENLCPRNLNQDPLENFFDTIRSGAGSIKPSCSQFKASYKGLIVANLVSINSTYINCEEDGCRGALNFLPKFLTKKFLQPITTSLPIIPDVYTFKNVCSVYNDNNNAYIARYLARYMLKKLQGCKTCKLALISDTPDVECRTYNIRTLLKPNTTFYKYISQSFKILHFYLPKICTFSNISSFLKTKINSIISPTFHCQHHNLADMIDNYLIPMYIVMWTQNIDNVLKGKQIKITDKVKKLALIKRHKIRSRRRILKSKQN